MAKKKAASRAREPEPPPAPGVKKNLVVIRGYEAWGEWLEGYAQSKGMPVVVLIDSLVRESAKKDGYPPPPARY